MFFTEDNVQVFSLDFLRSGGVYYGGFLGGLAAVAIIIHRYKFSFWKVGDAFAPAVALGQFFGRQGCFSAGCCWGKESHLPWAMHFTEAGHENTGVPIYYPDGSDIYLHPTQLYESFAMLAVFGILVYLHHKKRFNGQVLIGYMILYPIVRFTIEFFRDDPRGDFLGITTLTGLSTSQIISLIVAAGAIIFMIWRLRKTNSLTNVNQ